MSDPYEVKKAKIDSLVISFTSSGFKSNNRIGQSELLQILNKHNTSGPYDNILIEKIFEVLNLDSTSTIFVEDFINGFLQFEEDLRRNTEVLNIKLSQEQERYAKLAEECRRYKSEQLNSEGLCENAKVFGEITDIDIKRKLEGIKEIIIKVIYNEKSEELHFKIGNINSNEMLNKSFVFKPSSRKDHFEFIMKGVNDRNQVFDIGSKVFPLTDINSYEEYAVEIVVPEIENEEQIAAFIHAKIVLYWSDYKYYERLKRKAESRIKKLTSAVNKAREYLKYVREVYGDLTKKKTELIVDFNNQKIMERKGGKLNVNFNNQKEAEAPGGNYIVEFNNFREVQKNVESVKVELNSAKEVIKETIEENLPNEEVEIQHTQKVQETGPYINPVEENTIQEKGPDIIPVEENIVQEKGPNITSEEETHTQKVEYLNNIPAATDYTYYTQNQTETNYVENIKNGGQNFNIDELNGAEITTTTTTTNYENTNGQNGGMATAETVGYGASDKMGSVEEYGTGGIEYIDQNPTSTLRDSEIIKKTEIRTSINRTMVNESTNKTLFSQSILPVKILEAKIKEPIIDSKVKTLPLIIGRKSITYVKPNEMNNEMINNLFQNSQQYTVQGQENLY